ncbi:cyclic nucleotide-binding domain-containing protein [Streptomyces durbertensis]|nr:cyclic nucleotide-binding domain-containing protein [Streptomyces durbertensis]
MLTHPRLLDALPPESRERLMTHAREVVFPAGARIFEEGRRADRFWLLSSGTVQLDVRVPTRPHAVVDELHTGDLLGWSWLITPHVWHFGARAVGPVRALEFDGAEVRQMCQEDAELGRSLALFVARTVAQRLHRSRNRLLDLYGPQGLAALSDPSEEN